jgi:protein-L-isoaspartate(D-aspartate) O-methyltransferase
LAIKEGERMTDFAVARRMMVDGQVRTNDVTDPRIIGAMLELPRELFVRAEDKAFAYLDLDVRIFEPARYLLKPMVLARMVQAAQVREADRVLDVGCATGYSSALLARLASSVVALEEDIALAEFAKANLARPAAGKATVVRGPLVQGWPAQAPYDVIFLNGASEVVPHALLAQLKNRGRLIAVIGRSPMRQAMLYRSVAGEVSGWPVFDAAAPVLPGFAAPAEFVF